MVPDWKITKIAEDLVDHIKGLVEVEELYEEANLIDHIRVKYNPEDVFSIVMLEDWAFENGFRKFE